MTRVLIVVLIAACAYNWMQTQRLQAQVAALQMQTVQLKQTTAISRAPDAHFHFLPRLYSLPRLYFLQGQWERLQHQAGRFRSTRKKVLSYVKF